MAFVSVLNLVSVAGGDLQGIYLAVDRMGPPFASSIALALATWSGTSADAGTILGVVFRPALWALAGPSLLILTFRRMEITRFEAC